MYVPVYYLNIFSRKMSLKVLCLLSDWVIFIFIFELYEFCTYSRDKPQIIYIRYITCQYALLSHGLSFHFTDPIIWRTSLILIKCNSSVFSFVVPLIFYFPFWQMLCMSSCFHRVSSETGQIKTSSDDRAFLWAIRQVKQRQLSRDAPLESSRCILSPPVAAKLRALPAIPVLQGSSR